MQDTVTKIEDNILGLQLRKYMEFFCCTIFHIVGLKVGAPCAQCVYLWNHSHLMGHPVWRLVWILSVLLSWVWLKQWLNICPEGKWASSHAQWDQWVVNATTWCWAGLWGRVRYREGRCVNGSHWLLRAMSASVPLLLRANLYMGFLVGWRILSGKFCRSMALWGQKDFSYKPVYSPPCWVHQTHVLFLLLPVKTAQNTPQLGTIVLALFFNSLVGFTLSQFFKDQFSLIIWILGIDILV